MLRSVVEGMAHKNDYDTQHLSQMMQRQSSVFDVEFANIGAEQTDHFAHMRRNTLILKDMNGELPLGSSQRTKEFDNGANIEDMESSEEAKDVEQSATTEEEMEESSEHNDHSDSSMVEYRRER